MVPSAHSSYRWIVSAACWLALLLFARLPASAQQDDERPPEPKSSDTKPGDTADFPNVLKEGTLDLDARVYLLRNNKPIILPNISYDDLFSLNRALALRAEGGESPGYTIDDLTVVAKIASDRADIEARIKVTLTDSALAATEIPLRMQSCLLSQAVEVEGPGKSQFQVGRNDQPGYTWWLRSEPNSSHTARLVGQSVLQAEGDRQLVQLTLPLALANIELHLPSSYQDVRVRGQGGELVSQDRSKDSTQKVMVRCQGGDINISWRTSNDARPVVGAAEAATKTRLRVDDPREPWDGETDISLHAHGEASVDTLVIDLPEGAQWIPNPLSPTEQYTIASAVMPAPSDATDNSTGNPANNSATIANNAHSPVQAFHQTTQSRVTTRHLPTHRPMHLLHRLVGAPG